MVVAHTRCAMAGSTEADIHERVASAGGPDTHSLHFLPAQDQEEALRADVQRIRSWPYLHGIEVGGFRYDVDTGRLSRIC
jgi:carbonic anhydrase